MCRFALLVVLVLASCPAIAAKALVEESSRPEAAIHADLAAQLTVAARRFNSMAARDAATDPLR